MAAANTDKFRKTYGGPSTTLASGIDASQDSIQLVSVNGWPTDTAIDVIIDRIDAEGNLTPNIQEVVTGVVDPTGLINVVRGQDTTAQVHTAGAIVEPSINSSKSRNDMIDALLTSIKQDGTLVDAIVARLLPALGPSANQILKADGEGNLEYGLIDPDNMSVSGWPSYYTANTSTINKSQSSTATTSLASITADSAGTYIIIAVCAWSVPSGQEAYEWKLSLSRNGSPFYQQSVPARRVAWGGHSETIIGRATIDVGDTISFGVLSGGGSGINTISANDARLIMFKAYPSAGGGGDIKLYSSTGQNTDGAMTQKANSDSLDVKLDKVTTATTNRLYSVNSSGVNEMRNYSVSTSSNSIMSRDSSGRSQVAAPSADLDIVNKAYVDAQISALRDELTA